MGFSDVTLLATVRNARTVNPKIAVAEVRATRPDMPDAAVNQYSQQGRISVDVNCPISLDTEKLRAEVSLIYSRVASDPEGDFHFHRGPDYAAGFLGYDPRKLAAIPAAATASFAGVGNPHAIGPIHVGEKVLDIGCGAGMDLILAAKSVGPSGSAIGVDMTAEMCERARGTARETGLTWVQVRHGDAEALPLEDCSVDVVISNGVLNLVPDKKRAYSEIARVLRPGGRLYLSDIAVETELDDSIRSDIDLWTG